MVWNKIWGRRVMGALVWAAALMGCQTAAERAVWQITPARSDAQIEVMSTADVSIFDVISPSGIGGAEVTLQEGPLPPRLVFRLHLRGLEQFRLRYGDVVITVAATGLDEPSSRQERHLISAPAQVETLDASSRFWLPLRLVTEPGGTGHIPLENGYFELVAPPDLQASATRSFGFEWIDFFR